MFPSLKHKSNFQELGKFQCNRQKLPTAGMFTTLIDLDFLSLRPCVHIWSQHASWVIRWQVDRCEQLQDTLRTHLIVEVVAWKSPDSLGKLLNLGTFCVSRNYSLCETLPISILHYLGILQHVIDGEICFFVLKKTISVCSTDYRRLYAFIAGRCVVSVYW